MVLTVLLFGGTRLMAQDENNAVDPQTTPTIEENLESKNEGEEGASSVDTDKNTNIDSNVANDDKETAKTKTETPEANKTENTENAPKAKQKEKKTQAKEAEKPVEGNGAEDGAKLEAAPAKAPEAVGEGNGEGTGTGKGNDPKKPEVNPDEDKDLNDLKAQIEKEQDPKKKAELQKKYNEKYLDKLGSSDKLDKEVLKRFTDKEKTKKYYELKDEYDKLKEKAKNDKLSQKELDEIKKKIDKLNNELGAYKVPRLLDADEKNAQEKLNNSINEPSLNARESKDPEAQAKLDAYNNAKNALKDALNPDNARTKSEEELKALLEAFDKAEKDLKAGIEKGDIKLNYTTDGKPTVRVFPLINGSVGEELKNDPTKNDEPYYIPDNTEINLLLHINKDDEPKKFKFTIKAIDKGAIVDNEKASNLAFLNGDPVELKDNGDGTYTFTVDSEKTFGIAQLRFNIPGFKGAFHNGFDLEMDLNGKKVTKQFRITKKGYEDEAHLSGPGSDTDKDPKAIPEIDAGKTENAKVKEESAKEVYDFFTYLKRSNTYIDDVKFNSGNGESLPLNSVDITITVPKSGKNNFAEMIHKSGLEYYDLGNGKYQLKLDTKVFGGNLIKKGDKLYLKDGNNTEKELTPAKLNDVILENAGKKVYVKDGKTYDIITSEVLEKVDDTKGKSYKVVGNKLYIKNNVDANTAYPTEPTATFDKDGKAVVGNTTYLLKDNKLITYTKEYDVYDGYVANKDGKADPDVTPTYEGKQVTIETTTKDSKTETSYGGTIVKNAIYDKNGKIFKEDGYKGIAGEVAIGSDGKIAEGLFFDPSSIDKEKQTIEVGGKVFHIVKNPVFNKDGYIIDGLEYKTGLSLIDKFGKKMNVEVKAVTDGSGNTTYTFTRKKKDKDGKEIKDKDGNEIKDKVESGKNGNRNVIVGKDKTQILVNNKNEVVENEEKDSKKPYDLVGPKYYYDGTKFFNAEGDGLKGNKFLAGFEEIVLKPTTNYSYKDGEKTTEIEGFGTKTVYEGSLNPKDYFKVENKIYVKKSQGAGSSQTDYYVSADPNASNKILSEKKIAKIVQTLGNIEKVTDETDIFNAVQNAKFALKFPGFLAGKNIVYNVHAEVKATYKEPSKTKEGEFEEKSIFTSEKDKTKKIDKFFTLKNEKETNTNFFKHAPKELEVNPAVNLHFFNIFYRKADDRDRDQLIIDLLAKEEEVNKAKEEIENAQEEAKKTAQAKYDKLVRDNKEKLALIAKFKDELKRLYNGAKFDTEVQNDKKTLVMKDKDGKKIEADELNKMRSLLWEIGFNNTEGTLFPKNPDTEIVIEDHNMDNRLIYDEIIVNDTKENWNKLNKDYEEAKKQVSDAEKALKENEDGSEKAQLEAALEKAKKELEEKKFKGNDQYFFIDQIKDIRFGVNPNFIDGRFVPLGADFKITSDEILKALDNKLASADIINDKGEVIGQYILKDGKHFIKKGEIEFEVRRDKANGQIRIKVKDAFYKKVEKDSTHKFESPVQEAYQKKIDGVLEEVKKLNKNTSEDDINTLVGKLHLEGSECFGIIKQKLTEEFTKVKNNTEELKKFKKNLKTEIEKIELKYLDSKKGKYKYDDMRFNAIRIGLKPNITIGGAMTPQNTKKLGITSVIVPEIDIPYTDEFGNPLTNKDMYVKAEIEKILKAGIEQGEGIKPKKFTKDDLKNEEKFREIMAEAYKRVNVKSEETFKKLVIVEDKNKDNFGMEKYTVTKGSELDYADLAVDKESLKNKEGFAINPWFIVKGDKTKSVEDIFKEKFGTGYKDMPEYKALQDMPIDIAAYYMSNQGYDRNKYANQANYKLAGGDKKDGIFGSDSDWHKKICYPGIGHCIEQAGKDSTDGQNPEEGKFGAEGADGADFGLTYEPTNKGPDKENPKVDKKTEDKDKTVDISGEDEKSVDFTIDVTVDKMTKDQKDIADALTPEKPEKPEKPKAEMTEEEKKVAKEEKAKAEAEKKAKEIEAKNYKANGYYEYKKSLIIDFLPDVFKLKEGTTKLIFTADRKKLMENGANKDFADKEVFKKWQEGIEYFHTDDLLAYAKTLTDKEKAEVLKKAIDEAIKDGKIKEGQKVQAVLAWVPTFEAPHGSENQFTIKLEKLIVNKKKFKDFNDGVIGTNYTNHAAFGDKARFYFGSTTVNIHKDKYGKVNKYLQVLYKDGEVIDKDKADGWFMGNAELKFGDKFNYRIEYKNNNNIVQVPGESHSKSEINIKDLFAKVSDKGLRPVLNGFITSDLEKYEVIYKIGDKEYSESALTAEIKANKVKISDVTSVILKGNFDNGATKHFDIPMMIPNLDAKVEDGKVYYIGKDNEKHELGEAKDFFNLKDLTDKEKDLIAENKVEGSNTVTVYLNKERFIRVFKEFLAANGEKLKNLDNLEAKFDVYQIIEENGKKTRVKLDKQLIVNKDNNFTDMLDHLPIFKKTTTIDKDGNVKVNEIKYEYELEEAQMPGFDSKVYQMKDDEGLGFVWQAKNTEKPEYPGDHPHDNPKNVKVKITVNKVWKVLKGGETPSIQVELYANGEATGKIITLGADGSWSASFEDLPSKDANGKEIIYTVREIGESNELTKIDDRTFEVIYTGNLKDGFTIINKEIPPDDEKPKDKKEPKKHKPNDEEERDRTPKKNRIPKTGVNEDLGAIYFAFVLLLGLVFIKKRYLVK